MALTIFEKKIYGKKVSGKKYYGKKISGKNIIEKKNSGTDYMEKKLWKFFFGKLILWQKYCTGSNDCQQLSHRKCIQKTANTVLENRGSL